MATNAFAPVWLSHPRDSIVAAARARGLSVADLAKLFAENGESLEETLIGGIASDSQASILCRFVGGSARFWLARQKAFDERFQLLIEEERLDRSAWVARLPVAEMVRRGWIPSGTRGDGRAGACLDYFGVSSLSEWRDLYDATLQRVAFRTSHSFDSNVESVLAWLRRGQILSSERAVSKWSPEKFKEGLSEARRLTRRKELKEFLPDLKALCAEGGVTLAVVRPLPGCVASGASHWIDGAQPVIQLSLRFLSDDQFWFTFFHEAAHLLLHGSDALFLDGPGLESNNLEAEANQQALDFLVPPDLQPELQTVELSHRGIGSFARKAGISPGIVVGQLQHRQRLRFNQLNFLKRRYAPLDS